MRKELHRFFSEPSADLYYVLGLIFADGHVASGVSLVQKERYILDQIASRLGRTVQGPRWVQNRYTYHYLYLGGEALAGWLRDGFGLAHHKIHTLVWPQLDDGWTGHFIRGFFDGNGTVFDYRTHKSGKGNEHCREIAITSGTEVFLQQMQIWLNDRGLPWSVVRQVTAKQAWRLTYRSQVALRRFYELVYAEATLYLPWKRATLERLLAEYQVS